MLNVNILKNSLKVGLQTIMTERSNAASTMSDDTDPSEIIESVANDMASVIADAVDAYLRSGDIYVGPTNVQVTAPTSGGPCTVAPMQAAKVV